MRQVRIFSIRLPVIYILTSVLLFSFHSYSQDTKEAKSDSSKRYLNFLKAPSIFHFYNISMNGQYMLPGNIGSNGNGVSGSLGINLARFFTTKFALSAWVGLKNRELLLPSRFNENMDDYFIANADVSGLSPNDQLIVNHFIDKTSELTSLSGMGRTQLGVSFYYPMKFLPIFKFYRGRVGNFIDPDSGFYSVLDESEWMYLHYRMHGMELTFYTNRAMKYGQGNFFSVFSVSFFAEKYSLKDAQLQEIPVSSFAPNFHTDFKNNMRFGIKVGIEFL